MDTTLQTAESGVQSVCGASRYDSLRRRGAEHAEAHYQPQGNQASHMRIDLVIGAPIYFHDRLLQKHNQDGH